MLTCIACSKQLNTGSLHQTHEDDGATTPTKQSIKGLTAQLRDMAVKASVAYKHCKPCSRGSSNNQSQNSESESERFHYEYRRAGSSNSTPRIWRSNLSGEGTPASAFFTEEEDGKEWVAQVEPGVLITLVSVHQGVNDLKRIQFSRELFNKWQAQRWWAENYDKVLELYNVKKLTRQSAPLPATPAPSEVDNSKVECDEGSLVAPPPAGMSYCSTESLEHDSSHHPPTPKLSSSIKTEGPPSGRSSCESGEMSVSNGSDMESEWVEEDEPGVYITIRALPGGSRELRRVRFSREKFGEMHARVWWEENRARIQQQYL